MFDNDVLDYGLATGSDDVLSPMGVLFGVYEHHYLSRWELSGTLPLTTRRDPRLDDDYQPRLDTI